MQKRLFSWLLYRVMGFSVIEEVEKPAKYIMAVAPHTSNWDFIIGQIFCRAQGFRCDFMMKKEWFFWPLGILLRRLGGIPIHRSKRQSLTDQLARTALEQEEFHLCITPEGTRKLAPEWRKGFYYIALKAGIPILLYGLDYKERRIVCTQSLMPTGDVEAEMRSIKQYFQNFSGKHPENFTTGL